MFGAAEARVDRSCSCRRVDGYVAGLQQAADLAISEDRSFAPNIPHTRQALLSFPRNNVRF